MNEQSNEGLSKNREETQKFGGDIIDAPSPILSRVIARMPSNMLDHVSQQFKDVFNALGTKQLRFVINRMLQWPCDAIIYKWVLSILNCLMKCGYINLLSEIAVQHSQYVIKQSRSIRTMEGSMQFCFFLCFQIKGVILLYLCVSVRNTCICMFVKKQIKPTQKKNMVFTMENCFFVTFFYFF